ncbi:hypothetical protein LZD49_35210 [Dyadobacter sp. CY261]|uniref:hypothetical protein n=1 Tax=Dyadobacter sp. CY261 TaxID=2907203 RepID=UPI001F366B14|nr:hypothetical protein [Dyadobacter sp. CY261]MCF0075773.1 hypothetical protein [Dyadobacter sp. CY261]
MLTSVGLTIKGMATNPAFLLLSSSTVGFIQVFNYRKDLTIDLMAAVGICFGLMTFLGLVKHYKSGEAKAEIFMRKTVEQFVVMVSVVLLGYVASVVISVVFKIVTQAVSGANPVPGVALYFIFGGYAIMFTYYFIKSCDLIDQILPNLLPKWFSAPFRKFRETGDYKDLLSFQREKEEVEP